MAHFLFLLTFATISGYTLLEKLNPTYNNAVQQIKEAILQSQLQAAKAVNQEQLALYYGIGKYISENSREGFWGKGALETISEQLRRELPGLRGFSVRNLKNMRTFYEEWRFLETNSAVPTAKTLASDNSAVATADRAYVEYVLQDYNKPMGVATYKATQQKLNELLPDEEELKKLL